MISGFSNMQGDGGSAHDFGAANALPVPFNIPKVLLALIDPNTTLTLTPQQRDVIEALRFAHQSRESMLRKLESEEQQIKVKMLQGDEKAKERFDEIMMDKLQGFEHYLELIEGISKMLEPEQYQQLLESVGIKND